MKDRTQAEAQTPKPVQAAEPPTELNGFEEAANALAELQLEGALPEGFSVEEACRDRAFALLLTQFEPMAAVRIYMAEQRAAQAEQRAAQAEQLMTRAREDALTELSEKQRRTRALPQSARPNLATSAQPDYAGMDSEGFRKLERSYKEAAHRKK